MPFAHVERMEERVLFSRALGIDVSSNNHSGGSINWTSVYNGGVTFAYIKATQGNSYTNPYFASDIKAATDASIVSGAYDFANFNTVSATSEANYFLSVAGPYVKEGYLRPALDMEGSTSMSASQVSSWVNTWANTVYNATGVLTVVYASQSFAATYFNSTVPPNKQLWVADYNGQNLYTGEPNGWAPFSNWTMWQVSSTGSVPGISGNVDLDAANGDVTGYVIPDIVASSGAKFTNGEAIHVSGGGGQVAWNTYASNGTSVTEPYNENGTVKSGTPVYIRGYERVEVLYANQTSNMWSADNLLSSGSASAAAVTASAISAQPASTTNASSSPAPLTSSSLSNSLSQKDKLDTLVG